MTTNFNRFMSQLLQTKARDLYRSKGILRFQDEGNAKFIFQGVHENITYEESKVPWTDDEDKTSKVVLIGRNLDKAAIEASFEACAGKGGLRPAATLAGAFFGS